MRQHKKALYMISVVAELLEIHPQTLRIYEREGFIKPSRTEGNTRLYSDEDIESINRILHLTRELGVNLAGVEVILEMRRKMEDMRRENDELLAYIKRELRREFRRLEAREALVRVTGEGVPTPGALGEHPARGKRNG
jgi:MerR family transcriptional regulator/heat shock protein HspR